MKPTHRNKIALWLSVIIGELQKYVSNQQCICISTWNRALMVRAAAIGRERNPASRAIEAISQIDLSISKL